MSGPSEHGEALLDIRGRRARWEDYAGLAEMLVLRALAAGDGNICVGADRNEVHRGGGHGESVSYFAKGIGAHRRKPETSGKVGKGYSDGRNTSGNSDQSLEEALGWPISRSVLFVGELIDGCKVGMVCISKYL